MYLKKFLLFLLFIFFPINVFASSAKSTIVMDNDSGRVLYENNSNEKMLIASTTKIMTCIVVIENSDLSKKVTVGDEILNVYGTNIYVEVGEVLSIKDLLYGLMLRSGNDAAIVLANNVFSSEDVFINKMNKKAKEIGMNNTVFNNPHGLDDETYNYSTASDMALLARYAYKNKVFRNIISTKKYVTKSNLKSFEWYNRMSLINNYKYSNGGKNGYTPKAGKTLVSYASKNNLNLIIVTLDDNDIYDNQKLLFEKYFKLYNKYLIIDKNSFKIESSLINKRVFLKESFSYPLRDDEIDDISTLIHINSSDENKVGEIQVNLKNNSIGKVDIYSSQNKKEKDNILFKFKKLFIR